MEPIIDLSPSPAAAEEEQLIDLILDPTRYTKPPEPVEDDPPSRDDRLRRALASLESLKASQATLGSELDQQKQKTESLVKKYNNLRGDFENVKAESEARKARFDFAEEEMKTKTSVCQNVLDLAEANPGPLKTPHNLSNFTGESPWFQWIFQSLNTSQRLEQLLREHEKKCEPCTPQTELRKLLKQVIKKAENRAVEEPGTANLRASHAAEIKTMNTELETLRNKVTLYNGSSKRLILETAISIDFESRLLQQLGQVATTLSRLSIRSHLIDQPLRNDLFQARLVLRNVLDVTHLEAMWNTVGKAAATMDVDLLTYHLALHYNPYRDYQNYQHMRDEIQRRYAYQAHQTKEIRNNKEIPRNEREAALRELPRLVETAVGLHPRTDWAQCIVDIGLMSKLLPAPPSPAERLSNTVADCENLVYLSDLPLSIDNQSRRLRIWKDLGRREVLFEAQVTLEPNVPLKSNPVVTPKTPPTNRAPETHPQAACPQTQASKPEAVPPKAGPAQERTHFDSQWLVTTTTSQQTQSSTVAEAPGSGLSTEVQAAQPPTVTNADTPQTESEASASIDPNQMDRATNVRGTGVSRSNASENNNGRQSNGVEAQAAVTDQTGGPPTQKKERKRKRDAAEHVSDSV
ncbi:hypothetical protein BCR34DRAFT_160509 [Clohesyomyces aquaticus]|uniref:Uncharacterized protein n=1 Tax=Clohesyomyces aquaticus TaxID=1231657 RepID=A0A1Y1YI92_9PLEO|nr:hypothetical protein BCR34DRAFT_160509 [Clohesyomyces aquaticus]